MYSEYDAIAMYIVVTVNALSVDNDGHMFLKCYGPFDTKEEAQRQAKAMKRQCLTFVEFLWGDIISEVDND